MERDFIYNKGPKDQITLISKMAEVMGSVGRIAKNGYNSHNKYNYATEGDIVEAVRSELAKKKVMMFTNLINRKTRDYNKGTITEVEMEYTFMDGESGESLTFTLDGEGYDTLDKGLYKAYTGAGKYAIMKTFLIPTFDDPENDSPGDKDTPGDKGPKGDNRDPFNSMSRDQKIEYLYKLGAKAGYDKDQLNNKCKESLDKTEVKYLNYEEMNKVKSGLEKTLKEEKKEEKKEDKPKK